MLVRRMVVPLLFGYAIAGLGCARQAAGPVFGASDVSEVEPPAAAAPAPAPEVEPKPATAVAPDAVKRAEAPNHGLRERDREMLSTAELLDEVSTADAICVGENHPDARDHFAELTILRGIAERARMSGRELALGLEMVENAKQPVLDAYATHRIGERRFLKDSEWQKRWGYAFELYRPMLELARNDGIALFALNAPRELVHKVGQGGLDALTERERASLPEMDLGNAAHRERFDDAMRNHPKGKGKLGDLYAAQVLWDETMANAAATWLGARSPMRQLVIFAGRGHCVHPAIPERVRRRGIERSVSIAPLHAPSQDELDSEISGFDYALVFETTEGETKDS